MTKFVYGGEVKNLPELSEEGIDIDKIIESIEKNYLLKALERANGVKIDAARLLNLSFRSFRHRLQKYGIK
jgi:two-component system response regulator PilR (NtrC family)